MQRSLAGLTRKSVGHELLAGVTLLPTIVYALVVSSRQLVVSPNAAAAAPVASSLGGLAGLVVLGFLLAAVNPKNLLMAADAGVSIGDAGLSVGSTVGVIAIYSLIAASTVLILVIGYLIAAAKLRGPLDALRVRLGRENAVLMAVLPLVVGVSLIGEGVGSL